jgi:hypothetical protein
MTELLEMTVGLPTTVLKEKSLLTVTPSSYAVNAMTGMELVPSIVPILMSAATTALNMMSFSSRRALMADFVMLA